jgi:rod shape-determining protein MreD
MRYLILLAVTFVDLIFTNTVFPNINIAGASPDIVICTIASLAILDDSMVGAWVGLACGLGMDLFRGVIGFNALPLFLTGAAAFFVRKNVGYVDKIFLPIAFSAGAYFFRQGLSAILAYMIDKQFSLAQLFLRYMLPQAVLTVIFMLLVHYIMRHIYNTKAMKMKSARDFKRLG